MTPRIRGQAAGGAANSYPRQLARSRHAGSSAGGTHGDEGDFVHSRLPTYLNPIGAKMAEALGYDAFYMSGGNTSAHQLGWPDSGTSMRDMVDNARKIVLTAEIPVFADADTGYG